MLTLAATLALNGQAVLGHPALPWVAFNLFVFIMLALDLFVFHRQAHVVQLKEAVLWTIFWIALACGFAVLVWAWRGSGDSLRFLTGYVTEEALSVDNLFVFLLLFTYFRVAPEYQHRVLFWGIIGAVVMRVVFILTGVALMNRLHWVMYLFGLFLIVTAIKMAIKNDEPVHPERNPILRLTRKLIPVTKEYHEGKFFVREMGRLAATPLFIVLLVVETTDLVFAVDSVPAVIGVITNPETKEADPFIAYTSNIFAILGLRAMYFALAGLMGRFYLLHYGLAAILAFVGVKMILEAGDKYDLPHVNIPTGVALGVIALLLALSVAGSLVFPKSEPAEA